LRTLNRLVEAVSLDRLASSGQGPSASSGQRLSRYRFRHWLVQRSAYRSLDAVSRARLHEATGRTLEAVYAAAGERSLALAPDLARHYEAAGLPLEAARYRLEAGQWAARLAAHDEAIAHLERGLALLEGMPASRERLRLELALRMAMGAPAMLQGGWQTPAYTRALERLSDLVQLPELEDDPQRLTALSVLALSTGWSANPERSGRVGEQLLALAHSASSEQAPSEGPSTLLGIRSEQAGEGDRQPLMLGHWALGFSQWLRGQPAPAREHLGRAVALYDREANRPMGGLVAADPGVMACVMLGAVQWQLGYPDQGQASLRQAVAHAQELDQPSSLAFAHFVAAMVTSVVGRDLAAAYGHGQALQALGQDNLVYGLWAEVLAALAETQAGQAGTGTRESCLEQGLTRAVEVLSSWQAAGSGGGYAGLLLLQADVCARAGQPEMGLEAMDKAQTWIERTGMRATEAEVWRMRGDLLLAKGPDRSDGACAEANYHRALQVAREQQARLLELRAALRLARLWQGQGRSDEARDLLAGIYGWFTEGFDTVDLVEAKALLEALG
jgi:adenylate cyclase